MNFVTVSILSLLPRDDGSFVVRFLASTSWGAGPFKGQVILTTADLATALPLIVPAIKTEIVTWAASTPGGNVVLPRTQILVDFPVQQISGVRLAADATVTTNPAFADIGDLSFLLAANSHYKFTFRGVYTSAAGATGMHLAVTGPASPSFVRGIGIIYTAVGTPFTGAFAAYDTPVAPGTSGGATPLPFEVTGTISTNVNGGNFTLRCRPETNGIGVTILRGSFGELVRVDT